MAAKSLRPPRVFAVLVLLLGFAYLYFGVKLAIVGGSIFYALTSIVLVLSSGLLWRGNIWGSRVYGLLLTATVLWGLIESGANLWALAPRIDVLAVIGLWFLTPFVRRGLYAPTTPPKLFSTTAGKAVAFAVLLAVVGVCVVATHHPVEGIAARNLSTSPTNQPVSDWQHYGNTTHGTRFAQLDQITTQNVDGLKELWHVRTGRSGQFKATPLQVGDFLYVCTAMNVVLALDAETGEKRWEFDPKMTVAPVGFNTTCRGVSFYRAAAEYEGNCPARILMSTTDARLIALNAVNGDRCKDFGDNGEISLRKGLGELATDLYMNTSPPLIARNLAVVGARVADNLAVNEPSGVIRAFDAVSGKFVWAWDMGRPGVNTEPKEGEEYTRGTPNVWSMMSFDDKLGLLYLPTGNSTPDFFGAHRIPASEQYASSVVALDVKDGSVRWSFQTVHHDIWDYDVPSQPALIDLPQADGSTTPALVQATKRGELFMLDRRDGKPIAEVVEKPVPQNPVPEEWVSKTQPFSVGMPIFREDLTEARMWGLTPFDQMWCRIEFKKLRYEGHFTPPTVAGSLQYPGNAGGFNWGSVAIDEKNQLLIAHPLMLPSRIELIPREKVGPKVRYQQTGTPYGASIRPFMSPLGVPCLQPPYSQMAVVDLQTRKVVWSKPLGNANEMGPLGLRTHLPLPMGVPSSGGALVTGGGVIFFGGTMDNYLRAFDEKTGKVLWRERLPGTGQSTPISYLAPKSKRQIVIMVVPNRQRQLGMTEGPGDVEPLGGHIIAYALPE